MPSLNQVAFIEQAIDSVLNQSYQYIELIIADGGSNDGTIPLLIKKQKKDSRIKWCSEVDTGPANAINKALLKTRGTLIG
ncbi:MAG: glycosyltransferase, partial [Methylococcales bacterium]|nr:glycosyltransferase [Methylococcales bacterium]